MIRRRTQNEFMGAVMCGLLQQDESPLEQVGFTRGPDGSLACVVQLKHCALADDSGDTTGGGISMPESCSYSITLHRVQAATGDPIELTIPMKFSQARRVRRGCGWERRVEVM